MTSYSPSIIAFTQTKKEIAITILSESPITTKDVTLKAITRKNGAISERNCTNFAFANFGKVNIVSPGEYEVRLKVDDAISAKLQQCRIQKNEILALRVVLEESNNKDKVGINQNLLIPLFDNSQGSQLGKERTNDVLGTLSENLFVSEITCNKNLFFSREDITCQTTITNTTDEGVLTNVVTTLREGLPPGLTTYENLERTNILILPGESYSLSFMLPGLSYEVLNNHIGVVASFTTVSNDVTPFVSRKETTVWYTPTLLLSFLTGIFLLLSAILLRKKFIKFTTQINGLQKTNL